MDSPILDILCSTTSTRKYKISTFDKAYLESMKECGTIRYGGRVVHCPECGETHAVYNPCNKRGCPVCYGHRQRIWKKNISQIVLNTGHYHTIFSTPQELTIVWLKHKKKYMKAFFESIKKAIATITKAYGITPGCVASFQSSGRGMAYKPHVHCAITDGGIDKDGNWVKLDTLSTTILCNVVKETLYKILKNVIPKEDLPLENQINTKGYTVYAVHFNDNPDKIIGYMAHVASGTVFSIKKGIKVNNEKNTITFSEKHNGEYIQTELSTDLFVERYINHIPPAHSVTVRYYGIYSNKYRTQLEEIRKQFPEVKKEEEPVYLCPICKHTMDVIKVLEPYEEMLPLEEYVKVGPPE